jgi:hypothetical protein
MNGKETNKTREGEMNELNFSTDTMSTRACKGGQTNLYKAWFT